MRNLDRHLALWLAVTSVSAGVAMMAAPLYFPYLPAGLFFWSGLAVFFVGVAAVLILLIIGTRSANLPPSATPPQSGAPQGRAGAGGAAKVGGDGFAFGGPGGHGGRYGEGGEGGAAEVAGKGIAGGGAGGSAGEDGLWRPPAKSGFEILMRQAGLPVDPFLRQFGRGGAVPGYEDKLQVVERLRTEYFREAGAQPQTAFEDISAVPLDFLNGRLAAQDEAWRVRIVKDEYEFYIPPARGL